MRFVYKVIWGCVVVALVAIGAFKGSLVAMVAALGIFVLGIEMLDHRHGVEK